MFWLSDALVWSWRNGHSYCWPSLRTELRWCFFGGGVNLMVLNSHLFGGQPLGPFKLAWVNSVLLWMSATYYSYEWAHASIPKGKTQTHSYTLTHKHTLTHRHIHNSLTLNSTIWSLEAIFSWETGCDFCDFFTFLPEGIYVAILAIFCVLLL